jgi:hypothetical protein
MNNAADNMSDDKWISCSHWGLFPLECLAPDEISMAPARNRRHSTRHFMRLVNLIGQTLARARLRHASG